MQFLVHIDLLKPLSNIKWVLTLINQNLSIESKLDLLNKIHRESKRIKIGYCLLRLSLNIKRLKLGLKRISKNMKKIGLNIINGVIFLVIFLVIF